LWKGRFDKRLLILLLLIWIGLHTPNPHAQLAYVGPGAGFAFLGSFLTLIAGFLLSLFSLIFWPFRMLWRLALRRQGSAMRAFAS
jgi:hypothetical protein